MVNKSVNYSQLREELDVIVGKLQQDTGTDIDETVKLYERGADIINQLKKYLENTENRIRKLSNSIKE